MALKFRLCEAVECCLKDVIDQYGLGLFEINANEVLLKSGAYVLDVVSARDGVAVIYFDTDVNPIRGYNIFLYLLNKRRHLLVFDGESTVEGTYAEFVDSELVSLSQHLRVAGRDILSGSKSWIEEYSWPTVRPSPAITAIL